MSKLTRHQQRNLEEFQTKYGADFVKLFDTWPGNIKGICIALSIEDDTSIGKSLVARLKDHWLMEQQATRPGRAMPRQQGELLPIINWPEGEERCAETAKMLLDLYTDWDYTERETLKAIARADPKRNGLLPDQVRVWSAALTKHKERWRKSRRA